MIESAARITDGDERLRADRHAYYLSEECDMDDIYRVADAMNLGLLVATTLTVIFGTILTVYFVKTARRVGSLIQVLQREAEWRIRVNYELPPPMPLQEGKFSE